jgi:glycosyltransferase involved in cell wall biosynthesis
MPKIVEESDGGFVYDTDKELMSAMDQLLCDQTLRDKLGRRGYETLHEKWHPESHIRRYLELIDDIATRTRKTVRDEQGFAGLHAESQTGMARQ